MVAVLAFGDVATAFGDGMRAAGAEDAALNLTHQRGHDARDGAQFRAAVGLARERDAAQKPTGVGMRGRVKDVSDRAGLDQFTRIHHRDLVSHAGHNAEVMGDQDHGHVHLAPQIVEQPQDLRLNGHVERGGRLIRDDQFRLAHQRHGDHHALAQPA